MSDLFEKLLLFGVGSFVTLIAAFYSVGRDVSFMKGQLAQLQDALNKISRLAERTANLELDSVKIKGDIKAAHDKLRRISGHG